MTVEFFDRIWNGLRRDQESVHEQSPVAYELDQAKKAIRDLRLTDGYEVDLRKYLEFALRCGLDNAYVLYSCRDLAATLDRTFSWEDESKKTRWKSRQDKYAQKVRSSRTLTMNLYPHYFAAILDGTKTWEGRAYDPESDKEYPDIRAGDEIAFKIDTQTSEREQECVQRGLSPDLLMRSQVGRVIFTPTVHSMYQFTQAFGEAFQPMITGPSEIFYLVRAAVYYSFPNYKQRIEDNGFIGIVMVNPHLVE